VETLEVSRIADLKLPRSFGALFDHVGHGHRVADKSPIEFAPKGAAERTGKDEGEGE
jgi:hypothetical protein